MSVILGLVSVISLLATVYLSFTAIKLSYRSASDSEESIDLIGRAILDTTWSLAPAQYRLGPDARQLITATNGADSLRKAGHTARARAALCSLDAFAGRTRDPFVQMRLGLALADLAKETGDDGLARLALRHYDYALLQKDSLGILNSLYVKSLRWWMRVRLGDLDRLPRQYTALRALACIFVASVLALWAAATVLSLRRRRQRRTGLPPTSPTPATTPTAPTAIATPSSIELGPKDLYASVINQLISTEHTSWVRFNSFLTTNSILVLAWAAIFAAGRSPPMLVAHIVLYAVCLLGILSCVVWWGLGRRSRRHVEGFLNMGVRMERTWFGSVGMDFHPCETAADARNRSPTCWTGSYRIMVYGPVVFAGLYLILLVVSAHLGSTR